MDPVTEGWSQLEAGENFMKEFLVYLTEGFHLVDGY